MYKLITKYNNFISLSVKLFISFGATYYLWQHQYLSGLFKSFQPGLSLELFLALSLLSTANWYFEIKKWQFLASFAQKISFKEAFKQSLISFSISLLTPNRAGEYGVKLWFYPKKLHKKIFSLSLTGNISQLLVTLIMGITGFTLWYLTDQPEWIQEIKGLQLDMKYLVWIILFLLFGFALFYFLKTKNLIVKQPEIWNKSIGYAGLRYAIFSTQFLWLLLLFNPEKKPVILLTGIFIMYLFSALIPMLAFLDWAVKSSIAVWVLSQTGLSKAIIVKTVILMWTANFLVPFIAGLILMWFYKKKLA